ncbi:MAG: FkbM family methyltransferase [Terriglobales bacterium]|jgi:FkbM family methyltransferase
MPIADNVKTLLNHRIFSSVSVPLASGLARLHGRGVERIFLDDDVWIHKTSHGYFAYHQPYLRLDLAQMDEAARSHFLWGYTPKDGDVVIDVGAGAGEETLTFSHIVGEWGKVICIEAHPRTYRCLEKLVRYNRLENVICIHAAAIEPGRSIASIGNEDEYLANHLDDAAGVSVPATTIDEVHHRLNLGRVNFLKMNIEGSERLAIRGMRATLRQTEVLCVSCHDFLARTDTDDGYRTKDLVRGFLQQMGLEIAERNDAGLPPYIRDQVWGYNRHLMSEPAA